MPFFIVKMTHPDGPGWGQHAQAHVDYLKTLVKLGVLRASGPVTSSTQRAGFLIFAAPTRDAVEAMIAQDPFAISELIETLTIETWDPLFGTFAAESSGELAGVPGVARA